MDNKRIGVVIIIISVFMSLVVLGYALELNQHKETCPYCGHSYYKSGLTLYILITSLFLVAITLSLGFYLIFFEKSHERIMERLEKEKKMDIDKERFNILMSALDDDEKNVVKAVKEQDGITQSTLKLRTDMSKAKLSVVLKGMEKKGIIKKESKGKTFSIYLKKGF